MDKSGNSFIGELATHLMEHHGNNLAQVTVVFPNRRAGLFLRKELAAQISQPIWLPEIISMEDFVGQFSDLEKIETLEAVFGLFDIYKTLQKEEETFDQFYFWGEMILRDFEEIDQYMVDTKNLFTSIKSQKELDEEFYFLDEEDKAVIQQFWSSFLPQASKSQEAFLATWKLLLPLYEGFKAALKEEGKGYGGMIYREIAENLLQSKKSFDRQVIFAGFNALTKSEETIIKYFVSEHQAEVSWDLDAYYFNSPQQEAGLFLREYAADRVLSGTFPKEPPQRFKKPKSIETIGVSLEVGQTKALSNFLVELVKSPDYVPERTVIVLPHEHMLFPTLHAIPDSVEKVNITMGYPLKDTPVFSLIESALVLQDNLNDSVRGATYYFKPVVEILEHPLIFAIEELKAKELISTIRRRNTIRIANSQLGFTDPVLTAIFRKAADPLSYLLDMLRELHAYWKTKGHDLELEFISRFYLHTEHLSEVLGKRSQELSFDFLIKLYRRMSRSLKIPFTGEPLNGLQVMGILETRNLDFDRVFILNMNEDSWPAAPRNGSFIPFNIRKAFQLPVFDHQDAIYSYLFYRLLQRASDVKIFHNTVSEFNTNGELSRLVQQLEVESGYTIHKRMLASPVKITPPDAIEIEKSPEVLANMQRYLDGYTGMDASRFTPSALNQYLECRLKFYFKYVARLYEPDEVSEDMDPMVFGNVLHDAMEILYKQFIQRQKREIIYAEDIFWIKEGIAGAMNEAFKKQYGIPDHEKFIPEGRTIIAAEIIRKFMEKILAHDQQYAPFQILGLEASTREGYSYAFPVTVSGNQFSINIKGIIDRIDLKDGRIRILDYKTGKDEKTFPGIQSFTDRDHNGRNKAGFQVFFYAYLFEKKYTGTYEHIEPGLFNSKDLFSDDFNWQLYNQAQKTSVNSLEPYLSEFESLLSNLLTEIYDPEMTFNQTDDLKKCGYCPYAKICHR